MILTTYSCDVCHRELEPGTPIISLQAVETKTPPREEAAVGYGYPGMMTGMMPSTGSIGALLSRKARLVKGMSFEPVTAIGGIPLDPAVADLMGMEEKHPHHGQVMVCSDCMKKPVVLQSAVRWDECPCYPHDPKGHLTPMGG